MSDLDALIKKSAQSVYTRLFETSGAARRFSCSGFTRFTAI
jgi:hypothetical protein